MYSENEDLDEEYEQSKSNGSFIDKARDFYESNKKLVWIVGGLLIFLLLLLMLKGCSGDGTGTGLSGGTGSGGDGSEPQLIMSSVKENLAVGNTTRLIVELKGPDDALFVWKSSDESVATVDQLGNVRALKLGKTIITVTYRHTNNKEYIATCEITVALGDKNVVLTNVSFPEGELLITRGDKYQVYKQVTPSNGYVTDISYTSSNPSVATIDSSGNIEAISIGVTTITMNVNNNAFSDQLIVNVVNDNIEPQFIINPTAINFDNQKTPVIIGQSEILTYQVLPADAYVKDATWESSNISVATVDINGTVYGVSEGTAIITLKTRNGITATTTIEVKPNIINVTSISLLSSSNLTLSINDTTTIIPNVFPYNATDRSVTYTSSNSSVASVDQLGQVRALSSGYATITVKTNDQGMTANVNITVTSSGGTTGGGSTGGGSTGGSSCSLSSSLITLASNSKSLTDTGNGAIEATNTSGNSSTIIKNTLKVETNKINSGTSCGGITSLEYCSGTYSGASCSNWKSFNHGDTLEITLPSGSGVYQIIIRATYGQGTVTKDYYMKYNITGSSTTTTSACYEDVISGNYVWGNYENNIRFAKQSYSTKQECLYGTSVSWTKEGTKWWLKYGTLNNGIIKVTARSNVKNMYYCVTAENSSVCTITTTNSRYSEHDYEAGGCKVMRIGNTYRKAYSNVRTINFSMAALGTQRFCYILEFNTGEKSTRKCIKTN